MENNKLLYYKHCNKEWTDTHTSEVNSRCLVCRSKDIQPYKIEELTNEKTISINTRATGYRS